MAEETNQGAIPATLAIKAQKQIPHAVRSDLIAHNPTLELVAVGTTDKQVDVFRYGGQRAFGARSPRDKPTLDALCWKYNGKELAIWWSDNTWQILDSTSGNISPVMIVLHEKIVPTPAIELVAWEPKIVDPLLRCRFVESSLAGASCKSFETDVNGIGDSDEADELTLEELLSLDASKEDPQDAVEHLPKLLASFNIRDELPRLSPIPHIVNHKLDQHSEYLATFFYRQEILDATIKFGGSGNSSVMDFLVVGHSHGRMIIGLGSRKFGLCCMNVPATIHENKDFKLIGYASHPSAYCQAVLTRADPSDGPRTSSNSSFGIFYSSLNIIQKSGYYLPLIVNAIDQLLMLDAYINFSILTIREAWNDACDLFSKYIQNIEGTLSERKNDEMDLITALYRLVVTGHCDPDVEEWMKDIVGLKGLERWTEAYPKGIVKVINLIHGNLLPALDRCSVEASRLRAMSRNKKATICQFSEKSLTQLLDDLDILRVLSHSALLYARQEIPQIEVFATFMRCQIDILKEPDSSAAREAVETISGLDHALLLSFITGPMTRSHLNVFLGRDYNKILSSPRRPKQQAGKKVILSMLEMHSQGPILTNTPVVELVNLYYQSLFLKDTTSDLHKDMASSFCRATVNAHQTSLDWDDMSDATDIRMVFRKPPFHDKNAVKIPATENESMITYVVSVPEEYRYQLRVYRRIHRSALLETDAAPGDVEASHRLFASNGLVILPNCTIWDVKFVNDASLILLLSNEGIQGKRFLVQFPVFRFWELPYLELSSYPTLPVERTEAEPLSRGPPAYKFLNVGQGSQNPNSFKPAQVDFEDLKPYVLHEFSDCNSPSAFAPHLLRVRGSGRRVDNLLVLDEESTKYVVYDISTITWQWE